MTEVLRIGGELVGEIAEDEIKDARDRMAKFAPGGPGTEQVRAKQRVGLTVALCWVIASFYEVPEESAALSDACVALSLIRSSCRLSGPWAGSLASTSAVNCRC